MLRTALKAEDLAAHDELPAASVDEEALAAAKVLCVGDKYGTHKDKKRE
jgi:hypothetical protein